MKKIAIIGSGPTGIFTTLLLENFQGEVHLFEKNSDIGQKLKRTGGGRMNIMNKEFSADHFFVKNKNTAGERAKNNFFKTRFAQNHELEKIFSQIGTEYFWEKKRAILQSENAKEEVSRLKTKILRQQNCMLHLETEITNIETISTKDNQNTSFSLKFLDQKECFDAVVICTGGMFQVGEQCDKEKTYALPQRLGHMVSSVSPSLSPLRIKYHRLLDSSGIALPVKIFSGQYKKKQKKYEHEIADDLLITHFGFSGPAVLDFSALWNGKDKFYINFLPEISEEMFQRDFLKLRSGKNSVYKFLQGYLPKRLAENFCSLLNLFDEQKISKNIADISKKDEKKIKDTLFSFDVAKVSLPEKFPYQGCWTTKGGIELEDINIARLESNLQKNIFFGGEVLNIDGLCGGYHISFAAICGKIIAENILERNKTHL